MKLLDAVSQLRQRVERLQYTIPLAFVDVVRPNTPIDTGVLRNSWTWAYTPSSKQYIYNDAPYAGYVEFGTDKMAPRRYTQLTLRYHTGEVLKRAVRMSFGGTVLTTSHIPNLSNRSVPWW